MHTLTYFYYRFKLTTIFSTLHFKKNASTSKIKRLCVSNQTQVRFK